MFANVFHCGWSKFARSPQGTWDLANVVIVYIPVVKVRPLQGFIPSLPPVNHKKGFQEAFHLCVYRRMLKKFLYNENIGNQRWMHLA